MLRNQAAMRRFPIVFVAGAGERVARVRAALSDATYARWDAIAAAVGERRRIPSRRAGHWARVASVAARLHAAYRRRRGEAWRRWGRVSAGVMEAIDERLRLLLGRA